MTLFVLTQLGSERTGDDGRKLWHELFIPTNIDIYNIKLLSLPNFLALLMNLPVVNEFNW